MDFWLPCVLMGVGIAIDVTIATLSRFRDDELSFKNWTAWITGTHIIFPAFGYYLFWGMSEVLPTASLWLGIIGFVLVLLFVYEVVAESVGLKPAIAISDGLSKLAQMKEDDSRRLIAVLAVSWDALWSGPAKAAQAEAGAWSTNEVIFSFFVAGLTVAVISQLALIAAKQLRKVNFENAGGLARFNFWGKLIELSVIGGFGVLSLWQGITGHGNLYASIGIAAILLSVAFAIFRKEILANELDEAKDAVAGEA